MCGDFVEIIGRYCGKREENGFSVAFLYSLVPNIVIKYYLCGCEWLYGTYFGRFWGFLGGYEAVAMGQVFPFR